MGLRHIKTIDKRPNNKEEEYKDYFSAINLKCGILRKPGKMI